MQLHKGLAEGLYRLLSHDSAQSLEAARDSAPSDERAFNEAIDTAFQIATLRGPLCAEPMEGLAFIVESLEISQTPEHQQICEQTHM